MERYAEMMRYAGEKVCFEENNVIRGQMERIIRDGSGKVDRVRKGGSVRIKEGNVRIIGEDDNKMKGNHIRK